MSGRPLSSRSKTAIGLGFALAAGLVTVAGVSSRHLWEQVALGRAGAWTDGDLAFVFLGAPEDARLYLPSEFVGVGVHSWGVGWAVDAWNRPIRHRCPGPIHEDGWDLWSVGPDGVDEHGQGDDLVLGEDAVHVAPR